MIDERILMNGRRFRRPQTTDKEKYYFIGQREWNEYCNQFDAATSTARRNLNQKLKGYDYAGRIEETDEGTRASTACVACVSNQDTCKVFKKGGACARCQYYRRPKCSVEHAKSEDNEAEVIDDTMDMEVDSEAAAIAVARRELYGEEDEEESEQFATPRGSTSTSSSASTLQEAKYSIHVPKPETLLYPITYQEYNKVVQQIKRQGNDIKELKRDLSEYKLQQDKATVALGTRSNEHSIWMNRFMTLLNWARGDLMVAYHSILPGRRVRVPELTSFELAPLAEAGLGPAWLKRENDGVPVEVLVPITQYQIDEACSELEEELQGIDEFIEGEEPMDED